MNICLHCQKETKNPKFCNQSCAAVYNNTHFPKRQWSCRQCGSRIRPTPFAKICQTCLLKPKRKTIEIDNKTIADIKAKHTKAKRPWTDILRGYARKRLKDRSQCSNCGYSKHVEVCHIRDITDFPDYSLVSEVNSLENLVLLCPNCHWEFDNGLLELTPAPPLS